eukprot:TRINITY_DN7148_c0_g1_i1.p1 TRINITY_DN7148_c0_g1~~TRINITY_DN7148_c0_g1_i1.p1  ORF type:complete len:170 (-),score=26.10 TRINITY_DN7148_c0_g1_i1:377-886(-)
MRVSISSIACAVLLERDGLIWCERDRGHLVALFMFPCCVTATGGEIDRAEVLHDEIAEPAVVCGSTQTRENKVRTSGEYEVKLVKASDMALGLGLGNKTLIVKEISAQGMIGAYNEAASAEQVRVERGHVLISINGVDLTPASTMRAVLVKTLSNMSAGTEIVLKFREQ